MFPKLDNLTRIGDKGIIAVIRADSPEKALEVTEAVKNGGIDIIEITFTVPGAVKVLEELFKAYPDGEIIIGAGTVLDSETARAAMLAGAEFIVSPNLSLDVIRICNRYQKICIQGCMTISEIIMAMEAGSDLVKIFPGTAFGPAYVKDIKGPLPQVQLIPTGGVTLDNIDQWIKNGCFAVGVGSQLTGGANDYDLLTITNNAHSFIEKIRISRQNF